MITEYAKTVSHSQIFHGIEVPLLEELVKRGRIVSVKPQEPMVEEEQRVPGLFVILEGSAKITKRGKEIATVGRGAFFGEMYLFGVTLGASATVKNGNEPAKVLLLVPEAIEHWAKNHPQAERVFLRNMCTELCRRLYSTGERFVES